MTVISDSKRGIFCEPLIMVIRFPGIVAYLLFCGATALAIIYLCSIAAGYMSGFALPTTAIMRWSSIGRQMAVFDYDIIYALLMIVMLCVLASWVGLIRNNSAAQRFEIRLIRLMKWSSLVLACSFFVFSLSGAWSGVAREGDFGAAAIGGLVPFSDAGGYFASAHDFFKDHVFSEFSLRRPLAASARGLLLIVGAFSYADMMIVQVLLLAVATWFGACAISRWRGIWAGLVYFCLIFIVLRSFLPTTLTEPIGFFWALFAIPFFIDGLRKDSAPHIFLGFTFTAIALMTRMGAMFMVPALMLWIVYRLGSTWVRKSGVAVILIVILLGVGITNGAIENIYGKGHHDAGSNFSYTLCGLSIGGVWSDCLIKYTQEIKQLPPGEKAQTDFFYKTAVNNIRSDPTTFIKRLSLGGAEFLKSLPDTMLKGYLYVIPPKWFAFRAFYLLMVAGVLYVSLLRREKAEFEFWVLVIFSIIASAAVVYFDDGRRVMAVAYPFLCVFAASCFMTPATIVERVRINDRHILPIGLTTLVVGIALLIGGPLVAANFVGHPVSSKIERPSAPNVHYIYGGRRITGYLVVADDQPLPVGVPSIHVTNFAEIIRRSNIQIYQALVDPVVPHLPFAFITSPRLEKGVSSSFQYIAPPEVIIDQTIPAWKLKIEPWQPKPGGSTYWYLVTEAEPVVN